MAALIGNSSYNELLAKLTTAEPEPTTSRDDASEGTQRATLGLSTQQATTTEPPAVARQVCHGPCTFIACTEGGLCLQLCGQDQSVGLTGSGGGLDSHVRV